VAPDKEDEVVSSDITLDDEGQIYGPPPPGTAGFESPTARNPKGHPDGAFLLPWWVLLLPCVTGDQCFMSCAVKAWRRRSPNFFIFSVQSETGLRAHPSDVTCAHLKSTRRVSNECLVKQATRNGSFRHEEQGGEADVLTRPGLTKLVPSPIWVTAHLICTETYINQPDSVRNSCFIAA
jgi:hypothetical protein